MNCVKLNFHEENVCESARVDCHAQKTYTNVHVNLDFKGKQGNKPESPLFYFHRKKAAQVGQIVDLKDTLQTQHNVTFALTTLRSAVHTAFTHYVNFTLIKH